MSTTMHGFVMLGKTVPEPSRRDDGRIYVCSAGWHPDHGLIRIYPLGRREAPARWDVSSVDVERNPMDSRAESWRIVGDRTDPNINKAFRRTGKYTTRERDQLLLDIVARGLQVDSVEEANDRRLSLAVMLPDQIRLRLDAQPDSPDSPQLRLFDDGLAPVQGAKRFPYVPRLHIPGGHQAGLLLRDWGSFEWMRKQPGREGELAAGLHLDPSRSAILIGNLANQRTTWVAIAVLNIRWPQEALNWEAVS